MANALVDRHHAGLFHSLQLLGDRIGWDIYTPVGYDWWEEGYWRFGEVYGDDRLARQYLDTSDASWSRWEVIHDGRWITYDREYPGRIIHGIELASARKMEWEYSVATVQENQRGFHRWAIEHAAKYVYQVGNTNQEVDWLLDPYAILSSEVPIMGRGVRYHQEMHEAYDWIEPSMYAKPRSIGSFVNYMPRIECWPLMFALSQRLKDWTWGIHGAGCPDGIIQPTDRLAHRMGEYAWGYHDKVTGDGFGHVLWGWAAVGRPLIGHASHYKGKLGEVLWRDLETCIDLDKHPTEDVAEILEEISVPDWIEMCRAIHQRFKKHYDPDEDARNIARLLGV